MAVLGPNVSVNMNGHNNIHSQLTKSLERILEDAYLSGELKLSGRKLREFPKPVKYDLSDTVVADLSKNRFSEVPDEVTTYIYLEKLLLSQNIIRSVPDGVGGLQSLTYLDLSSNQLTELPREVCLMPLQVLLVPDNVLTSLPKEIGKMTTLAELDASNNRLTQVPMTLGDCTGLRCLDLSNNQLGLLPLQITYLRLEHLDVSCNCISSLPLELRNMSTIITLNLDNNPLVSPPTTICMRGRVHIFKYLENMANKDSLPAHRRVDETRRSTKHSSYISSPNSAHITSGNATIDCLRHKPRHVVDSGYCTDGVDKRWSNDAGGEAGGGSGRSTPSTPSTLSPGAALSRTQSLSSETPLAPLTPILTGLRISPEGTISNGDDKSKLAHQQTYRQYKEALRQQRQQDVYRPRTDQPSPELDSSPHSQSPVHFKSPHSPINGYSTGATKPTGKLAWNKDGPVDKLSFTMKREFDKQKEETELLLQLRSIIESRLKMSLPEQLSPVLADGVVLCHLANHVRPRSVASVHVPSPAQPKLTMARCRRNVDNFLEACRKIGVEEEDICSPDDILGEATGQSLAAVATTIFALLEHTRRSPKDIQPDPYTQHREIHETHEIYTPNDSIEPDSIELNYNQQPYQVKARYNEDRYISNFNFDNQNYTFDESEEYQLNYENNNTELQNLQYSPVYNNELRIRGPYYQNNRIQFVTPFCKRDGVFRNENFEIYDTDEVDFPVDSINEVDSVLNENVDSKRYDRGKMSLDIQANYNNDLPMRVETATERENRIFYTCLCLGSFVLSAILLILYPL
nr:leucine-rich repeat and calponin homology domain-containing protein isoform X3 [Maniola hyperantus]